MGDRRRLAAAACALVLALLALSACASAPARVELAAVVVDRWMERPRTLGGEEAWLVAFRVADQDVLELVVESVSPDTWDKLPAGRRVTLVGTRRRGGRLSARMEIVFAGEKAPPPRRDT